MEEGGERWSKPHVATLYLHSLFELKKCIEKGTVMLDMEANSLQQIVGKIPSANYITLYMSLIKISLFTNNGTLQIHTQKKMINPKSLDEKRKCN